MAHLPGDLVLAGDRGSDGGGRGGDGSGGGGGGHGWVMWVKLFRVEDLASLTSSGAGEGGRGRLFGVMRGFGHVAVFTYYIEKSFNEAEIHISIFDLYHAPY